jgi:hypothetical protein
MFALGFFITVGLLAPSPVQQPSVWLQQWSVIGPYLADDAQRVGEAAHPERLPGRRHAVAWQPLSTSTGAVAVDRWISHPEGVSRLRSTFRVEGGGALALHLYVPSAYRLWVDGAPVHRALAWPVIEVLPVTLSAGVHVVDLVVAGAPWMAVGLTDRAGNGPKACAMEALGTTPCVAFSQPGAGPLLPWRGALPAVDAEVTGAPLRASDWAARGDAALAAGDRVAALAAWSRSLALDPVQSSLEAKIRSVDPDLLAPAPVWPRALPPVRPAGATAGQILSQQSTLRLWRDGRLSGWTRVVEQIDDPARIDAQRWPGAVVEAWVHPALGGARRPWVRHGRPPGAGDRVEFIATVESTDGVLPSSHWPIRALELSLTVDLDVGWRAVVPGLDATETSRQTTRTLMWRGAPAHRPGAPLLRLSRYATEAARHAAHTGRLPHTPSPAASNPPIHWVEQGAVERRAGVVVARMTRSGGARPDLAEAWPGAEHLGDGAVTVPGAPILHGPAPLHPWTRWRVAGPELGAAFEVESTWTTSAAPRDAVFSSPHGLYARRATRLAEGWRVVRRYKRRGGRIPEAQWADFLAFCARVEAAERAGAR